jgi:hypothetical protein
MNEDMRMKMRMRMIYIRLSTNTKTRTSIVGKPVMLALGGISQGGSENILLFFHERTEGKGGGLGYMFY